MQKEQQEFCAYCNKWFAKKNMISSHEKGKQIVLYYCESCYPEVRSNINSLPWKDNYTFYRQ